MIPKSTDGPKVTYALDGIYDTMINITIQTAINCRTLNAVLIVERLSHCGNNTERASKCDMISAKRVRSPNHMCAEM